MKEQRPTSLVIGLVLGIPTMAVGIVGLAQHMAATPPSSYVRFFVGGNIVNDFVVAPLACLVGLVLVRFATPVVRPPLRAALFASAIVLALAWPALRGYGRDRAPDNSTVQPLNYATATISVLVVVWLIAVVWLALSLGHARRARKPE